METVNTQCLLVTERKEFNMSDDITNNTMKVYLLGFSHCGCFLTFKRHELFLVLSLSKSWFLYRCPQVADQSRR